MSLIEIPKLLKTFKNSLQKIEDQKQSEVPVSTNKISKIKIKKEEFSSKIILEHGELSSSNIISITKKIELPSQKIFTKSSEYILKQAYQTIITIESGFYDKNPYVFLIKTFGKNWFYKPWNLTKTLEYYQGILELIGSA